MHLPGSYLGAFLCALGMAACSLALLSPHHSTRKDTAQGHRTRAAPYKRTAQAHRTSASHKRTAEGSPHKGTVQGAKAQGHCPKTPPTGIAKGHCTKAPHMSIAEGDCLKD